MGFQNSLQMRQEAWAEEVVPFIKAKHIFRSRKPPYNNLLSDLPLGIFLAINARFKIHKLGGPYILSRAGPQGRNANMSLKFI